MHSVEDMRYWHLDCLGGSKSLLLFPLLAVKCGITVAHCQGRLRGTHSNEYSMYKYICIVCILYMYMHVYLVL